MLKFRVMSEYIARTDPPDIFYAASNNDVEALHYAIGAGQSLNDRYHILNMTPMHIACISGSKDFLEAALELDFDPWAQDANQRTIWQHAFANNLTDVCAKLRAKMYPEGWAEYSAQPGD